MSKLEEAIARLDAANAQDPNTIEHDGAPVAKELLYARRMSAWLARIEPEASESLRLAVRAQHLCRWRIPRGDYPEGRVGYKRWRSELARLHARLAGEILAEVGYDETTIARVGALIQKQRLKQDPEAQTLEDVACLVFLAHYFAGFAAKHDDDKVVDIVRKTWKKMSPRGHELARGIAMGAREADLVARALAG